MVDVEHRGLTALEQHGLAALEGAVEHEAGVDDHGPQPVGVPEQLVDDLVDRNGAAVVDLDEQVILDVEGALDLLAQDVLVEQVLHADAEAVDLVGVGGADPAARGADLPLAEKALGHLVHRAVVRGDDVGVGADEQLRDVDAARTQSVEFTEQHLDVDDDAVGDDGGHPLGQNAARQQVQRVFLIADNDGVAGVITTVELDDVVDAAGEQIGGLTFSFIAPLGADDNDGRHGWSLRDR